MYHLFFLTFTVLGSRMYLVWAPSPTRCRVLCKRIK